jgi:hypothetical protein
MSTHLINYCGELILIIYKFADIYSEDNGIPNFPVKIIISLEILKHSFEIIDKELL